MCRYAGRPADAELAPGAADLLAGTDVLFESKALASAMNTEPSSHTPASVATAHRKLHAQAPFLSTPPAATQAFFLRLQSLRYTSNIDLFCSCRNHGYVNCTSVASRIEL